MKHYPSDSSSDHLFDTNSSYHMHSKHPQTNLRLPKDIKEELFKAIAKNEARRLIQNVSLSEISKYLDPK